MVETEVRGMIGVPYPPCDPLVLQHRGDRHSVEALLKYCELQGWTSPERDRYSFRRMEWVAQNCSPTRIETQVGGVYSAHEFIIENWEIIAERKSWRIEEERLFQVEPLEPRQLLLRLLSINRLQPKSIRIRQRALIGAFEESTNTIVDRTTMLVTKLGEGSDET